VRGLKRGSTSSRDFFQWSSIDDRKEEIIFFEGMGIEFFRGGRAILGGEMGNP